MKKIMGYDAKYWLLNLLLSLAVSFAAVFCIPDIVNWSIGAETDVSIVSIVGLVLTMVACFILFVSFKQRRREGRALQTVLTTVVLLFFMAVTLSVLCGILALLLHDFLHMLLNFGQIKGIIDFLTTIIVMLSIPLMISVFWQEMWNKEGVGKAFLAGFSIKGRQYIQLLVVLLILFGCGLIITTLFHYIPVGFVADLMKMLLFAVVGTLGINLSEKIVMEGAK